MCVVLYVGSAGGLREQTTADLTVRSADRSGLGVAKWFAHPVIQVIGAHTGCSCGFPSVISKTPIEFYEGLWDETEDRAADLRSVAALIQLLRRELAPGRTAELFPVWSGDED